MPYQNGWDKLIFAVYFSNNYEFKKIFIDSLEKVDVIENILNYTELDSETLDNIASNIDNIIEEINYKFSYSFSCFKEMECYSEFSQKKLSLLQNYLDDESTVFEVGEIFPDGVVDFDLDYEVSKHSSSFTNDMPGILVSEYTWQNIDIDKLDYSELEYNLAQYIQTEYEDQLSSEDDYDDYRLEKRSSQYEEKESLTSILNKPLL